MQPGNWKQETVIKFVKANDYFIQLFINSQDTNHIASLTMKSTYPEYWGTKPNLNRLTDNRTVLL